ncbi:MAG TPA: hypothetical protein VJB87_01430 [Candidatus Nanoarchaeia archaeon]|nr:hypothetical protein [Candidatus Nanoarchaeia archaeon]
MKPLLWLILLLFLASCAYNAEVITIDPIIASQEEQPIEQPLPPIPPVLEEPQPETALEEVPTEEVPEATLYTYEATVLGKATGESSYRVRTTYNKDLRIFTREKLATGDKIRFTIDTDNIVQDLEILEAAATTERYH